MSACLLLGLVLAWMPWPHRRRRGSVHARATARNGTMLRRPKPDAPQCPGGCW